MDINPLQNLSEENSQNLLSQYSKALGIEDDKIQLLKEVLDTIKTILERNKVHEKSLEWDETGAKLVDGKVVLPESFEKVLNESEAFEGVSQVGAVNIYGVLVAGHQVAVVGEVPVKTVEKIARSVTFSPINSSTNSSAATSQDSSTE